MKRKTISSLLTSILVFSLVIVPAITCSSIEAQWYSDPPCKYSHDVAGRDFPSALIKLPDIEYEYWSNSGYFKTFYGPLLLPFVPNEPPIMNDQDVRLKWRIDPMENKTIEVDLKSLVLKTSKGKSVRPTGIRIDHYKIHGGQRFPDILEYYSCTSGECDAVFPVKQELLFELWYLGVRYSEEEWYETRPVVKSDGENLDTPVVRFEPDRERNYTPFESPFYFPAH